MRLDFGVDVPALNRERDRVGRAIYRAQIEAVKDETRELELEFERLTLAAGGGKLARAWKSRTYPGPGKDGVPAGIVFPNGKDRTIGAIRFFTQDGRITAGGGQYLAIPTKEAGARGRKRDLTPGEWERRTGQKLRFVYRPGKSSLLVLDEAKLAGKRQVARRAGVRAIRGGTAETIVIFVLVPVVSFRRRVALDPVVRTAGTELVSNSERRVRALGDVR
jgi:hypothetical protein